MAVRSFVLDAAVLTELVIWAHWFRWWACAVFTTITSISTDSCLCTRANERNGLTAWANHLNILKTLLKLLPLGLVRNDFPSLGSDSDLQVLPLVLGAVTAWVILTALQHVSVVFFNHSLGFLHCVSNVILEVLDSCDPGIVDRLLQLLVDLFAALGAFVTGLVERAHPLLSVGEGSLVDLVAVLLDEGTGLLAEPAVDLLLRLVEVVHRVRPPGHGLASVTLGDILCENGLHLRVLLLDSKGEARQSCERNTSNHLLKILK